MSSLNIESSITVGASVALTSDEQALLRSALPEKPRLAFDSTSLTHALLPSLSSSTSLSEGGRHGLQYSFGIDLQTILAISFAPLPAIFLKKFTEEAGKAFWVALKNLLDRVGKRRKAVPLGAMQVQFSQIDLEGTPVTIVVTVLNAQYCSEEEFAALLKKSFSELDDRLAPITIKLRAARLGSVKTSSRLTVHIVHDGTQSAEWAIHDQTEES